MHSNENGSLSNKSNGIDNAVGTIDPPLTTEPQQKNSWTDPGPAAFDFRSDVVTTPTASMLRAIAHTSLLDDVFREDTVTNDLERYVADLTGHEAGLLVVSGTMGNQLSIRTHLTQPPQSVVADERSHVMQWEAGGLAFISSAMAYPVAPRTNGHHLTLSDIQSHAVTSDDIHACPTALICLENTLGGTILPLSDCRAISTWARAQSPRIGMHLDGARIWEAAAAAASSSSSDDDGSATTSSPAPSPSSLLRDYTTCFDSISLCFSKGLGAPLGSMLVGSSAFISRARKLRKPLGGGLRQAGIISAPARVAIDETFLSGKLSSSHVMAKRIANMWESRGGRLLKPCETNMVWFDLVAAGCEKEKFVEIGVMNGIKVLGGGRLVVHYQIGEEAVRRLELVMDRILYRLDDHDHDNDNEEEGRTEKKKEKEEQGVKRKVDQILAPEKEYGGDSDGDSDGGDDRRERRPPQGIGAL